MTEDELFHKYRIERVHGRGALGVTCDAKHQSLAQRVVLAVIGCSVGISAFVVIQNLKGVLALRGSERAVVASLSPAPSLGSVPPATPVAVQAPGPTPTRPRLTAHSPLEPVARVVVPAEPPSLAEQAAPALTHSSTNRIES